MPKPHLYAVILAFLCAPVWADNDAYSQADVETSILLRDDAMSGPRAWNIEESLTTEVGPRLAGSEAEARARDWAIEKLTRFGFENVRAEPFMIEGWRRGAETAEVVSPFQQKMAITSLCNSLATPENGVEAEVVLFESLVALKAALMIP